ncbi:MAG: pilus assembly protein PilM [Patescibacteria group bacterium]|jgi:type IV pilus assembly protein PilM
MFFKKPDAYIGVDIGAGGIKIVELKKEKNRPVLFTYGFTRQPQEIHRLLAKTELKSDFSAAYANNLSSDENTKQQSFFQIDQQQVKTFGKLLRTVCAEAKTQSKIAVASLPVSSVFHAVVTMPKVKKEEFDRILNAEVKKLLPYPLEQMALEHEIFPGGTDDTYHEQRVLVNAAPKALVVFYTEVFKEAGLQLESLEPESIALSRALIGRDTATAMLIDIGAERTNFFIVEQTFPITHHSIELGGERINQILAKILGIDMSMINRVKKDLFSHILDVKENHTLGKEEFLTLFSQVIDPIIKEIEYSLELYTRQSNNRGKKPEKIILSGGSAFFPYLAEKISEKFNIKCYVGDPWGRVVYQEGLKPALRTIAPRLAVSIGLALRNVL